MARDALIDRLSDVVGAGHVLAAEDVRAPYEHDATGRYGSPARLVVRPGSASEVAGVLAVCHETRTPVVPQGGNTGLVGGGVPRGGEVLLSVARLDELGQVDPVSAQVTVGAGVTLQRLQEHAHRAGLAFGVDHGARSGATVGGMVATDAGGAQVLRYGTMRAQVAGLEAVLADGRVVRRLAGLLKDTAGYALPQLLVGSEGTLGVITAVRVRLVPALPKVVTALLAVEDTGAAMEVMRALRSELDSLTAVEVFYAEGLELVCAHRRLAPPFGGRHPVYVLAECAGRRDPLDALAAAVEPLPVLDVAVADDSAKREDLWAYRELHNEAIAAAGVPHKLDVTVPLAGLVAFEAEVRATIATLAPDARTVLYGHLGDGNLHVNVLGLDPHDDTVDEAVLRLVSRFGGSISAEHGIGVSKPRWLGLTRSAAEISAMTAIKHALDPRGILNPGAVLPEPEVIR